MGDAVADHPGAGQVDLSLVERLPHLGEPVDELICERKLDVGAATGEREGATNFVGGVGIHLRRAHRLGTLNGIQGSREGQLPHVGVELGLVVSNLAGSGLEEGHLLMAIQPGAVDTFQQASQFGTGRHLRQSLRQSIGQPFPTVVNCVPFPNIEHTFDFTVLVRQIQDPCRGREGRLRSARPPSPSVRLPA